ncbi:MAG: hypothetical protein IJF76_01050 [Clostridia bacterium]|nr:hypothetical protein [Clostridia bacterium]
MADRFIKVCAFINRLERRFGNLNEYFAEIFEGRADHDNIIGMFYLYDQIDGLDIDFSEYNARFGDRTFEWQLEKVKVIAKEIYYVMKNCPEYKPEKGITNRYKSNNWYDL